MSVLVGKIWKNLVEMQEDLECGLKGKAYFWRCPISPSVRRVEILNDTESYTLDFIEIGGGYVKIINISRIIR